MNIWYFFLILICFIGMPYFCLIQRRRYKFRRFARYFQGEYVSQGLFKTGSIKGIRKDRSYTIKVITAGINNQHHFRTLVSIECNNNGALMLVQSKFFKNFPNWKYISKLKEKKSESDWMGKIFNTGSGCRHDLYLKREEYDLDQSRKAIIEKLFKTLKTDPQSVYKMINKILTLPTIIQIEKDKIIFDISGLIMDIEKINEYLNFIEQISILIEKEPVPT